MYALCTTLFKIYWLIFLRLLMSNASNAFGNMPAPFQRADIEAGYAVTMGYYRNHAEKYKPYAEACAEEAGHNNAELGFATRFLIDATIRVLTMPSVKEAMPDELVDRGTAASIAARMITRRATRSNGLQGLYTTQPVLHGLLGTVPHLTRRLGDPDYVGTLGAAVPADVSQVLGGAIKALREHPEAGEGFTIVGAKPSLLASRGLLQVSRIVKDKELATKCIAGLGVPYVDTRHLYVASADDDVWPVRFTSDARSFIEQYHLPGRGCPARRFPAAPVRGGSSSEFSSDLEKSYADMVHLLVTDTTRVEAL
jgi:hypothetical protein